MSPVPCVYWSIFTREIVLVAISLPSQPTRYDAMRWLSSVSGRENCTHRCVCLFWEVISSKQRDCIALRSSWDAGKKSLVLLYMLAFIVGALANQRLHFTKSVPFWRTEALLLSTSGEFFILRTNTEIGLWKNLLVVGNGVWNDPLINMSNWPKFDTYLLAIFMNERISNLI